MSQIDLIRLFIRICDAFEFWLVPQSMRFASALYVGVRNLLEKFSFRVNLSTLRLWCGSWLWRLIRRPAARLPVWLCKLWPRLWSLILDAVVILGGSAVMVFLWLFLWT